MSKPEFTYVFNIKVLEIVDGDTITVEIDLGFDTKMTRDVRLSGFDAPEIYFVDEKIRRRGEKAKDQLTKIIDTHTNGTRECLLHSVEYKRGMYGRIIAVLWAGDTNINDKMAEWLQMKREQDGWP